MSSPEQAESGETTQSHDENRRSHDKDGDENKDVLKKDVKAPFPARRLDSETSAEDSAQHGESSDAFSDYEDPGALSSPHDAGSLPLPVRF